jgi:hypothetical protein
MVLTGNKSYGDCLHEKISNINHTTALRKEEVADNHISRVINVMPIIISPVSVAPHENEFIFAVPRYTSMSWGTSIPEKRRDIAVITISCQIIMISRYAP